MADVPAAMAFLSVLYTLGLAIVLFWGLRAEDPTWRCFWGTLACTVMFLILALA